MSYITVMAVGEGVIMTADRAIMKWREVPELNISTSKPLTKTAKKLFALGDNIGVAMGQAMFTENHLPVSVFVD